MKESSCWQILSEFRRKSSVGTASNVAIRNYRVQCCQILRVGRKKKLILNCFITTLIKGLIKYEDKITF